MVFMCNNETIDNLPFSKPPRKPQSAEKMVCIDGVFVVKLANGKFVTSARDAHKWAYPISADMKMREPIIRGLAAMGVISKAEADEHMDQHKAAKAAREKQWSSKMLKEQAAKLGVKLTKSQLAKCAD